MVLPIWAYAAGAALALGGAATAGWTVRDWKCEAAQAKALRQAAKDLDAAATRMRDASAGYQQGKANAQQIEYHRQNTIRTIYRDRAVADGCAAPDDVRGVLDGAVAEVNAALAGGPGAAVPADTSATRAVD